MQQNKSFILREIGKVPYLLPYGQMIADHMRGMKLNSTAVFLWNLLEQEKSMEELLTLCVAHYEVTDEELPAFENDIRNFIGHMLSFGVITDRASLPSIPSNEECLLSIAGLNVRLQGPQAAFPKEFSPFFKDSLQEIHQTIQICIGIPHAKKNGTVLLRNEELVVLDAGEEYILLFPTSKHICEIHLKKSADLAICYCLPPYNDTFHYDLFHASRLLFLYLAQLKGMVAIHSASLLYEGKAWIFSGHSGMGKSTHTNLWNDIYNTPIINGDLNLLAYENNAPMIHGIPWCGTSGICNTESYPLGGIVLLNQAPTDYVEELSADQKLLLTTQRLISPCWSEEMFDKNLSVMEQIVPNILVCKLHCTKNPTAPEVMKGYIDSKTV